MGKLGDDGFYTPSLKLEKYLKSLIGKSCYTHAGYYKAIEELVANQVDWDEYQKYLNDFHSKEAQHRGMVNQERPLSLKEFMFLKVKNPKLLEKFKEIYFHQKDLGGNQEQLNKLVGKYSSINFTLKDVRIKPLKENKTLEQTDLS